MQILQYLLRGFKISVSGIGLLATFYTSIKFTYFISNPHHIQVPIKDEWIAISSMLFTNMFLITLFVFQHTLMALPSVKKLFKEHHMADLQRSLYVIATSASLLILIKYWQVVPNVALWKVNLAPGPLWWVYVSVHVACWILIYVGCICMDITELVGIKQVYYSLIALPDPMSMKSFQLQKLYLHMRHPGFIALLLLFWVTPIMSLDRLLLSTILTSYMYVCWKTDQNDYIYQKWQYEKKFHELDRLQ